MKLNKIVGLINTKANIGDLVYYFDWMDRKNFCFVQKITFDKKVKYWGVWSTSLEVAKRYKYNGEISWMEESRITVVK